MHKFVALVFVVSAFATGWKLSSADAGPALLPKLKTVGHIGVAVSDTQRFRNSDQVGGITITHEVEVDGKPTLVPFIWLSDEAALDVGRKLVRTAKARLGQ